MLDHYARGDRSRLAWKELQKLARTPPNTCFRERASASSNRTRGMFGDAYEDSSQVWFRIVEHSCDTHYQDTSTGTREPEQSHATSTNLLYEHSVHEHGGQTAAGENDRNYIWRACRFLLARLIVIALKFRHSPMNGSCEGHDGDENQSKSQFTFLICLSAHRS